MASPSPRPDATGPEPSTAPGVPLTSLGPGARAHVVAVEGELAIARRLLDLGFVPGTEIEVVRRAPLGDPTEYALRGCRLCLRRSEGARIRVVPQ